MSEKPQVLQEVPVVIPGATVPPFKGAYIGLYGFRKSEGRVTWLVSSLFESAEHAVTSITASQFTVPGTLRVFEIPADNDERLP
mgnify:CR=1 FL=1